MWLLEDFQILMWLTLLYLLNHVDLDQDRQIVARGTNLAHNLFLYDRHAKDSFYILKAGKKSKEEC